MAIRIEAALLSSQRPSFSICPWRTAPPSTMSCRTFKPEIDTAQMIHGNLRIGGKDVGNTHRFHHLARRFCHYLPSYPTCSSPSSVKSTEFPDSSFAQFQQNLGEVQSSWHAWHFHKVHAALAPPDTQEITENSDGRSISLDMFGQQTNFQGHHGVAAWWWWPCGMASNFFPCLCFASSQQSSPPGWCISMQSIGAIRFLVNLCTQLSRWLVKINVGAIFVSINGPSLTRPRLSSTTPQHIGGTNTPQHMSYGLLQDAKSSNANWESCSMHRDSSVVVGSWGPDLVEQSSWACDSMVSVFWCVFPDVFSWLSCDSLVLGCFPRLQLVLQRSTATSNKKNTESAPFQSKSILVSKKNNYFQKCLGRKGRKGLVNFCEQFHDLSLSFTFCLLSFSYSHVSSCFQQRFGR